MSKKRIVATLVVILAAVLINVMLIKYNLPYDNYEVNIKVTMNSDKENGMQLFYLEDKAEPKDGFIESNSQVVNYKEIGKQQELLYKIPADVSYLRLDIGAGNSTSEISSVQLQCKDKKISIPVEKLEKVQEQKTIQIEKVNNRLNLIASEEDPHLVWNTSNWGIDELVAKAYAKQIAIQKGLLLACLDIVLAIVLLCWNKFMEIPIEAVRNKKLIFRLSKNDFKTKFAGSYLGIIWAFIQPIVTVLVYWFVFEKGLKAGGINTKAGITAPFVLWLVAGLVPWFFFSDALNGGTNALVEYSYLVKKVVFKISILPIVKVISALFVHVFFIGFTLVLYAAYHYYPDGYTLQIIYYSFAMLMFALGLSYANSAIVVFFRDWTQVINIILQVGVWMTPIMWNIDTMELSPVLITIFKLNPMYYIVAGYREALISKSWFWENPTLTIYFWIITIALFGIGTAIFRKLKVHFADVL